jgi:hypothetical protein
MIEKKKIELDKTRNIIERLNEIPGPIISAQQFIVMYFDDLQKSGKSLKAIHQFLQSNGIDVGTYESFRTVYGRLKRSRKKASYALPPKPEKLKEPVKAAPTEAEKPKDVEAAKALKRQPGLGLKPIFLADGTEVEIDPDTGARIFQIKSNKEA